MHAVAGGDEHIRADARESVRIAGRGTVPDLRRWLFAPLTASANGLQCPPVKVVWNEAKNLANQKKHGVSFQEARRLFVSGADYLEVFDELHSEIEDRFIAIGPITRGLVLVVWTEQDEGTIRIISARQATPRERRLYLDHLEQLP